MIITLILTLIVGAMSMDCQNFPKKYLIFDDEMNKCAQQFRCEKGYQTQAYPHITKDRTYIPFEFCGEFNPETLKQIDELEHKYSNILLNKEIRDGKIILDFERFKITWSDEFFRYDVIILQGFDYRYYGMSNINDLEIEMQEYLEPLSPEFRTSLDTIFQTGKYYSGHRNGFDGMITKWGYIKLENDKIKVIYHEEAEIDDCEYENCEQISQEYDGSITPEQLKFRIDDTLNQLNLN